MKVFFILYIYNLASFSDIIFWISLLKASNYTRTIFNCGRGRINAASFFIKKKEEKWQQLTPGGYTGNYNK